MSSITHKIGDSIKWNLKNFQDDKITPVDWSGSTIHCTAINKYNSNQILFDVNSESESTEQYITTDKLSTGEYTVVIKNTDNFPQGEYLVDFKYSNIDGFKQSTKSITLKVMNRL